MWGSLPGLCLWALLACMCSPAQASEAVQQLKAAIGDNTLVLLGEMHGTQEIPAIAADLVADFAKRQPVLLVLEADAADQPRVDRFLRSDGDAVERARLLAGAHWQEPMHDGRDSLAMFELIERIRRLRAAGADVDVVLMDVAGPGDRDARMAAVLRSAVAAHPGTRTVALMGNVHAITGQPPRMLSHGKPYEPPPTVGRRLADLSPLSVDVRAREGTFWACREHRCGPIEANAAGLTDPLPRMEHNAEGDAWMLTLLLPRFRASPPAVGRP